MLSGFLLMIGVAFLVSRYTWILSALLAGIVLVRAFSKNSEKRKRELWVFELMMRKTAWLLKNNPLTSKLSLCRLKWNQRKEYRIVRCPKCRKNLRLPKSRGKIIVTCPMCGHEFQTKT